MMLLSFAYLLLFLAVGLLLARRAVPDAEGAVLFPLGCGFGVSLLAVLPAVFSLALGFALPAVLLAAAVAGAIGAFLLRSGTRLRGLPKILTAGRSGPAYCLWRR